MIANLIAAAIGAEIDDDDGDSGVVGALVGVATVAVLRRVIPAALVIGGAWYAQRYIARKYREMTADAA